MHAGNHSAWPKDKRMTGHNHSGASLATQDRWRRRRDSNPRDPFEPNGFQDRRFQPLTHSSAFDFNPLRRLAGYLCLRGVVSPDRKGRKRGERKAWILSYGEKRERFCDTSAIQDAAYLLVFHGGSVECFIQIAPGYIRAIVFLCEPLTHREPHRSIAFTGRNSSSPARRRRDLL